MAGAPKKVKSIASLAAALTLVTAFQNCGPADLSARTQSALSSNATTSLPLSLEITQVSRRTASVTAVPLRACDVPDGSGTQRLEGDVWTECQVTHCRAGYSIVRGSCQSVDVPTISISSPVVVSPGAVLFNWSGGSDARRCETTTTKQNGEASIVSSVAVSGTGSISRIETDTLITLKCLDRQGRALVKAEAWVRVNDNPLQNVFWSRMALLGLERFKQWNTNLIPRKGETPNQKWENWEVVYDGDGWPIDKVPSVHAWDNPLDDDVMNMSRNTDPGFLNESDRVLKKSFSPNNPGLGFLTVDRESNVRDHGKGGVISRRDPFLSKKQGFTMELRVKIDPRSGLNGFAGEHAFAAYYAMDDWAPNSDGTQRPPTVIGLSLSPRGVGVGGYREERLNGFKVGAENFMRIDTTVFRTYRIVQYPNDSRIFTYVDGIAKPLIGSGNHYRVASVNDQNSPYVIVGGEQGSGRVHFTLDYVAYRRGAYPPGVAMPAPIKRNPPALPRLQPVWAKLPMNSGFTKATLQRDQDSSTGIFGPQERVEYQRYKLCDPGQPYPNRILDIGCAGWATSTDGETVTPRDGRFLYYDQNKSSCVVRSVPGLKCRGDVTIEARIKVLQGDRAFSMQFRDLLGTSRLVISPEKAELLLGVKNVGYQAAKLKPTADGFHTYRLVRPAGSLYSYLYIDGDSVPAITVDQHACGSTSPIVGGMIAFGRLYGNGGTEGRALVDYIRWSPTAFAPALD